ncbi:MAG TPA: hypothetical protein VIY49_04005 [Bryobacteraceae bacterium]
MTNHRQRVRALEILVAVAAILAAAGPVAVLNSCSSCNAPPPEAVTTYHYDNLRTGWNPNEVNLNYSNVSNGKFQLLHTVGLDDQVDAQPLVVPNVNISAGSSPGKHDVVYVATEGNTIYAIDASSGATLLSPNFGTPVKMQDLPGQCNNNGPNVGINGTPVIDLSAKVMYVIVYTQSSSGPAYTLHELDLGTLTDKVPPVPVGASHTLTNGKTYPFQASYQRQRPGLLLANGNLYAGFGSFCDNNADLSRGRVLGWNKGSLTPLPANQLNDILATSPDSFFLSSIWMSGYGLAADDTGNLYFVTGNSDTPAKGPTTYDPPKNIQESVVKLSADLTKISSIFTPSNVGPLDQHDTDFGSGGVLLLPEQNPPLPRLATAAGKDGRMFLLNRDNLGGYTPGGPDNVVGTFNINGCWCGQSYFFGNNRTVVSSGGNSVILWQIQTSPKVTLSQVASSPPIGGTEDPGFFTSVSSAGATEAIVWAVSRPNNSQNKSGVCQGDNTVYLYAFNAGGAGGGTLPQLFKAAAGTWPACTANTNIVPVEANAKVYVAANQQLAIFGLK